MKRMALWGTAVAAGATMLTIVETAYALRAEFPLTATRAIASPAGGVRLLCDAAGFEALRGELIISAFLEFDLPGRLLAHDVDVVVQGLETPWVGRDATWTAPWTRPGGDIDVTYAKTLEVAKGRPVTKLALDVTLLVREMTDGTRPSNGFLVSCPSQRGDGFSADEVAALGSPQDGRLVVTYQLLTPFGYHDGSLSALRER